MQYILHPAARDIETGQLRDAQPGENRVAWITGGGFSFDVTDARTARLAAKRMEFAALPDNQASRTRKCTKDVAHISLSWAPGEQPSREEKEEAIRSSLASLGMDKAMYVAAEHTDKSYTHVHIIASRIRPDGYTHDALKSQRKPSAWAQQWETEHGGIVGPRCRGCGIAGHGLGGDAKGNSFVLHRSVIHARTGETRFGRRRPTSPLKLTAGG